MTWVFADLLCARPWASTERQTCVAPAFLELVVLVREMIFNSQSCRRRIFIVEEVTGCFHSI